MVHALLKYVPKERLTFLHLQTYPGLQHQERYLKAIESRFEIHLEVQPSRQQLKIKTGKLQKFAAERDHWRKHYECDLMAYGFRSDESVSRSVVMRQFSDGINLKSRERYPLKRWNRSIVTAYATKHKLPMAVEYQYPGLRDCGEQYTGFSAVWLHDNFLDDFKTACTFDPYLAAEYSRQTGHSL